MERYTYLLINILSVIIPLIWSFHPKLRFDREWKRFWPACMLTAIFFIVWDMLFTRMGIWGFNDKYLTGIKLLNLPVEEWMFFVCIPYSCLFTYHCLKILIKKDYLRAHQEYITKTLALILLLIAALNTDKLYTSVTFLSTGLFLLLHYLISSKFLSRFYLAYAVILIPFFITNGILTGTFLEKEIVWYNDSENLGIRMFTIPVEDSMYGLLLILMNVSIFEILETRKNQELRSGNLKVKRPGLGNSAGNGELVNRPSH